MARSAALQEAVSDALSVALQPLPVRPLLFDAVLANLAAGAPLRNADMALRGYRNLRQALIGTRAGGELLEGLWREALACGYFSGQLAWHLGFDLRTAAGAGLLHRCGEAAALAALAAVEERHPLRLDNASRSVLCAEQGGPLATRLMQAWQMPALMTQAVLAWRHAELERDALTLARLVYLAHLLAIVYLEPEFAPPGIEDAAAAELGVAPEVLTKIRDSEEALEALLARAG